MVGYLISCNNKHYNTLICICNLTSSLYMLSVNNLYNCIRIKEAMNQFISPHQNININISYNLGAQDKIPKVVFGKKLAKIVKSTVKQQPKPFYKAFKKSEQTVVVAQETKKTKSNKKGKTKKKSQILLTLPDQQQPQARRFKTEGNIKAQVVGSLIKKEKVNPKSVSKTNTQHFKSMNNPTTSSLSKPKKTINNLMQAQRPKKQQRRHSNKSCILSQPKKHILLSDIEHIISTTTNGPIPLNKQLHFNTNINGNNANMVTKKRANSANVIKSDKFINRLLDMSVLTSELGGSIPLNQDKNKVHAQGLQGKAKTALQAFMSSVDMRIIKKMEQDNQTKKSTLVDFGRSDGLQLITFLNKIRRIPMQKLHQKATKIQKFWRRKSSEFIIPYYSNMFFRNPAINSKVAIEKNLEQISGIENIDEKVEEEADISDDMQQNKTKYKKMEEIKVKIDNQKAMLQFLSAAKVSQISKQSLEESINTEKVNKIIQQHSESPKQNIRRADFKIKQFQLFTQQNGANNKPVFSIKQQAEEDVEGELSAKNKINIEKYKQLVRKQIESTKQASLNINKGSKNRTQEQQIKGKEKTVPKEDLKQKQDMKAQSAHWNHVHNILSNNMSKKVPVMSKAVLEQLMRQSAYNKQWVEGQFSNGQSLKTDQKQFPDQEYMSEEKQEKPMKSDKLEFQQFNFSQNSQQAKEDKQSSEGQIEEVEYNWSKYSDISKIKKPQQFIQKNRSKETQIKGKPQAVNIGQLKKGVRNPTNNPIQEPNLSSKSENLDKIPGLLPSGVGKQLIQGANGYGLANEDISQDIQMSEDHDVERDEKWIRQQMIMEDGIVEKYLDCGLDYFGLNLNKIVKQQENGKDEEQKEEHKAKLQKQYRHGNQQGQYKEQKQIKNKNESMEHKQDDDLFSNDAHANNEQDMELVYVFQNIDGKKHKEQHKKHLDVQHAMKNSKRNDGSDHLGIRQDGQVPIEGCKQGHGLFQPSFGHPPESSGYTEQQLVIQEQLNTKRKQKITESIITKLIQQFAYDVSIILRKSHNQSSNSDQLGRRNINSIQLQSTINNKHVPISNSNPNSNSNNNQISIMGIQTSFQSIRDFITKLKQFLLQDLHYCQKIVANLKNNIGPTSMEILTYLRIDQGNQFNQDIQPEDQDNQEFLFVIPNELFQTFNKKLLDQEELNRGKKLTNKFKLYTEFWHRSIFQCYNECLDYERPYGITGAPYNWICEPKLPKKIEYSQKKVEQILESAESRLLELSCSSSGIIFDKPQSPYQQFDLNEEQRSQMNEQKISRMLANQILDDEYNWITYNDQITQLLVDISRKIEEILIFQLSSDLKKIIRRRKMMVCVGNSKGCRKLEQGGEGSDSQDEQHAVFMVQDLI